MPARHFWFLFFSLSHSIDGQQTGWQSQEPRAPWGRQHKEIYKQEDEGCGAQMGKKKKVKKIQIHLSGPNSALSSVRDGSIFNSTSPGLFITSVTPSLICMSTRSLANTAAITNLKYLQVCRLHEAVRWYIGGAERLLWGLIHHFKRWGYGHVYSS